MKACSDSSNGFRKKGASQNSEQSSGFPGKIKKPHIYEDGRVVKTTSAARNPPVLHKKLFQRSHIGLVHSPYQSHLGGARLDLNLTVQDNFSTFTKRVMSAKLLRLKQLQNQLSEAHLQLNELYTENRLLRALQKRQDLALDRYEGAQAQLPQLVRSHHEEVRVLRTKYKNAKTQFCEILKTLKERETELQNLKEQHSHLLKLSRDRQLGAREALSKQVLELQSTVSNQQNSIEILNRKVLLETKNLKHQLHLEMQRHKATQSDLQDALSKMEDLHSQLEQIKEKQGIPVSMQRTGRLALQPCSRLPGLRRPGEKVQLGGSHPLSTKVKSSIPESDLQNIPQTTDPSSDQPDSSVATFSEKTNEYSTSLDSSPEHAVNGRSSNDAGAVARAKSILFKDGKERKQNSPPPGKRGVNNNCGSPRKGSFNSSEDFLKIEYKNALDMLSELSTKDRGDCAESNPSSLDLDSIGMAAAKHVANVASVTFSLKGSARGRSGSLGTSSFLGSESNDHFLSSVKELKRFSQSVCDAPQMERRNSGESITLSSREDIVDKLFEDLQAEKDTKMPWEDISSMMGSKDSRTTIELVENVDAEEHSALLLEDEDYQKESLLRALKAIDDDAVVQGRDDSGSDDSDISIPPRSVSKVLPGNVFTPIHSNTLIIRNKNEIIKRRPFK